MSERKMVSAKQAVSYRNYRRARDRALSRLAQAYPNDYKELLEQEKASDEQMGKKWFASDAVIGVTFVDTRATTAATGTQAIYGGEDESDRGGEA